ncbi:MULTISPECIES: hypothetical protein, partial [unclassified Breznakia]|uniref:hypothetical protein n=1 Tax=unclassified Breznakia TaxID=2623764 RepID=UPI002474FFC9
SIFCQHIEQIKKKGQIFPTLLCFTILNLMTLYVGYLLDSNIIIGIIRDKEEVLNIVKTLDKSKSLFVCSTTIEEVQNYSDLHNINPHLYNRISIIETIRAITLSNSSQREMSQRKQMLL